MNYKYKRKKLFSMLVAVLFLIVNMCVMWWTFSHVTIEEWVNINSIGFFGIFYIVIMLPLTYFAWPPGIRLFNSYLRGEKINKFQKKSSAYNDFIVAQSTYEKALELRKLVKLQNYSLTFIPHFLIVLVTIFIISLILSIVGIRPIPNTPLLGNIYIFFDYFFLIVIAYFNIQYFQTFLREVSIIWNEQLWDQWCVEKFGEGYSEGLKDDMTLWQFIKEKLRK